MIEEIKLLLPLLESATNGAAWLVVLYFSVILARMALVATVILLLAKWAFRLLYQVKSPNLRNIICTYQFDIKGGNGLECYFDLVTFRRLLREIGERGGPTTSVHTSHVEDAIEALREARK